MTHSPTPAELLALKTAHAALRESKHPAYDIVSQVVFALGKRQLLQSPETAAELQQLEEDLTGAYLARWEEEQDNARLRLALASAQRGPAGAACPCRRVGAGAAHHERRARRSPHRAEAGGRVMRLLLAASILALLYIAASDVIPT